MNPTALLAALSMMNVDEPGFTSIEKLIADGDFTYGSLLGCVRSVPYTPQYLGQKGFFSYTSSTTDAVKIEFDGQDIILVQSSVPNSPGTPVNLNPRAVKTLTPPRIARTFTVEAAEVKRYREIGSAELETVQDQATRKLRQAVRSIYATWEYHRLGAINGKVLDADGSTVLDDYFAMLSISQPTLDMDWNTTTGAHVQIKVDTLLNTIEDALGAMDDSVNVVVLCGRTFWQNFTGHQNVIDAYKYFESQQQAKANSGTNPNRDDLRYEDFRFKGVRWRQYRGSSKVSGSLTQFMPASEAHVALENVDGTNLGVWCPPSDNIDAVNKPGEPLTMTMKELDHKGGYEFRVQSNTLHIMTRPSAAIKLYSTSAGVTGSV